ncbi:zinc-dependent metalloprotease [Xylanimonas sp. McL0601]|uniref:zinc-dependent metalloprotease n=1 Tax=Xylanimonas sp. McL0601 TaxID=3414739 RepID=UPI003CF7B5D9
MTSTSPQPVVDWPAAADLAGRLAPPGPHATRGELDDLVAGLREAASDAVGHVLATTRMTPVGGLRRVTGGAHDGAAELGPVLVVDRARWALANTQVMAAMTAPVATALADESVGSSQTARLGGALEVGGLLAVLAPRVLGQFDPYAQPEAPGPEDVPGEPQPGRLLLVAPNVLHAERAMGVDPRDFRLWVCLHEQTHAVQFAAAPWLAEHLRGRVGGLMEDVTRTAVGMAKAPFLEKLGTVGRTVTDVVSGAFRAGGAAPFERLLSRAQKDEMAEITAVMALLEGHADVMMDAVGPRVVRSVRQIRAKFEKRRDGEGAPGLDVVLRRLLGMDAKLAQYRDGAAFVRAVEQQVGRDGLNAVWASAGSLPTAREIADPRAWVRRVHG